MADVGFKTCYSRLDFKPILDAYLNCTAIFFTYTDDLIDFESIRINHMWLKPPTTGEFSYVLRDLDSHERLLRMRRYGFCSLLIFLLPDLARITNSNLAPPPVALMYWREWDSVENVFPWAVSKGLVVSNRSWLYVMPKQAGSDANFLYKTLDAEQFHRDFSAIVLYEKFANEIHKTAVSSVYFVCWYCTPEAHTEVVTFDFIDCKPTTFCHAQLRQKYLERIDGGRQLQWSWEKMAFDLSPLQYKRVAQQDSRSRNSFDIDSPVRFDESALRLIFPPDSNITLRLVEQDLSSALMRQFYERPSIYFITAEAIETRRSFLSLYFEPLTAQLWLGIGLTNIFLALWLTFLLVCIAGYGKSRTWVLQMALIGISKLCIDQSLATMDKLRGRILIGYRLTWCAIFVYLTVLNQYYKALLASGYAAKFPFSTRYTDIRQLENFTILGMFQQHYCDEFSVEDQKAVYYNEPTEVQGNLFKESWNARPAAFATAVKGWKNHYDYCVDQPTSERELEECLEGQRIFEKFLWNMDGFCPTDLLEFIEATSNKSRPFLRDTPDADYTFEEYQEEWSMTDAWEHSSAKRIEGVGNRSEAYWNWMKPEVAFVTTEDEFRWHWNLFKKRMIGNSTLKFANNKILKRLWAEPTNSIAFRFEPSNKEVIWPPELKHTLRRIGQLEMGGIFGFLMKWDRIRFPPVNASVKDFVLEDDEGYQPIGLSNSNVGVIFAGLIVAVLFAVIVFFCETLCLCLGA